MSSTQKIFLVNELTPENKASHQLHTFIAYWYPSMPIPRYRWCCACGYRPRGTWQTAAEATLSFHAHSGHFLPAWPPLESATLITP